MAWKPFSAPCVKLLPMLILSLVWLASVESFQTFDSSFTGARKFSGWSRPSTKLLRIRGGAGAAAMLGDYRGAAAALFNNMRTPAALISGAIVPLGLLGAPRIETTDTRRLRILKRAHQLLALASMYNELMAITYSTIAVNKLTEVNLGPTQSVVELIGRDYELAWIGTNLHFLAGLAGFGLMVGLRPFFNFGASSVVARIGSLWTLSMLFTGMSIVNRGIAQGDGTMQVSGRFAANLWSLCSRYCVLLARDASGVLSILSAIAAAASFALLGWELVKVLRGEDSEADENEQPAKAS